MVNIIVATTEDYLIGSGNKLPWHLPSDLKHFKELTTGNVVIMGRKTFESISKPLPNRTNVIITRNKEYKAEGCVIFNSLSEAIITYSNHEIFIIGGGEIYKEALYIVDRIYLTRIMTSDIKGDTYLPSNLLDEFTLVKESEVLNENNLNFKFQIYE